MYQLIQKYPKVFQWFEKMMKIPEIEETNLVPLPIMESLLDIIDNKVSAKL